MNRRKFFGLTTVSLGFLSLIGTALPARVRATPMKVRIVKTSLDKVNFRRVVLYIKQNLQRISREYVFESCDETTRRNFHKDCRNMLNSFKDLNTIGDWMIESEICPITRNKLIVNVLVCPVNTKLGESECVEISFTLKS